MPRRKKENNLFDFPVEIAPDVPVDEFYDSLGFRVIAGVDEAGRGALAGPVCAAAVILGNEQIDGLNDSKLLLSEIREELCEEIWAKADGVGVAMVGPGQIDILNILWASMEAMKLAVRMLANHPDLVLVDGDRIPPGTDNAVAIIKGDMKSKRIMAASIVAKVTRDRYMISASREFPQYGFAINKGYAVPAHYRALRECGLTPIHRRTFAPCMEALESLPDLSRKSTMDDRFHWEKSE